MAAPKKVSPKLVEKIGSAYIRLSQEGNDESEIRRKVVGFTVKALGMLGFNYTADVMEQRGRKLAEVAITHAKRRMLREQYLTDLKVGGPKDGYTIDFLPDVRIERTPETEDRWRDFLGTLAPKTRIGPDPETGEIGVLYREGEWLGDLMLADDMHSFSIMADIRRVRGDLIARGALAVNALFTHEVEVMGGLHIHQGILRNDPPPITYHGELRLYGLKSLLDVAVPPARLEAWGVEPGRRVVVRSDELEYCTEQDGACALPGSPEKRLKGVNVLSTYCWRKDHWTRIKQERIDPSLFEKVHARLNRLCLVFGLGQDMIAKSVSRTPDNAERIALYLDMCLEAVEDAPDEPAGAARRLIEALAALRAPFMEKAVNADAVEEALERVTEEEAELAAQLAELPRAKSNEKLMRADLATLTHLSEDEVAVEDFFRGGLETACALNTAFRSADARANLRQALRRLADALADKVGHIAEADRPSFDDLLAAPHTTRGALRKGLSAVGGDVAQLDAELRETENLAPKAVFRQVTHVPFESEDEDFLGDRALLRALFETRNMSPDGLKLDADRMLGLVLPRMKSAAAPRLGAALAAMRGAGDARPVAAMLASRLGGLAPAALMAELRAWMRSFIAVCRMYNSLSVAEDTAGREDERMRKEMAMATLPVHVMRDLSSRLSRACLLWGLGRDFIEGVDATMGHDIERVLYYLDLNLGRTEAKRSTTLEGDDLTLVREAADHFRALRHCLDTADTDAAGQALSGLGDAVLQRVGDILAKPRTQVQTFALRADREYLDGLKDTQLTLQKVFKHSGQFLMCANNCLHSTEMRRAASVWVKPLYFGLTKLGRDAGGVTANDLLRSASDPQRALERIKPTADAKTLGKIAKALEAIGAKSIEDVVAELRKSGKQDSPGELGEDYTFLGRVLALLGTPLGTLQLDAAQTCKLLANTLDSHIAEYVKTAQACGRFHGAASKAIVRAVLDRLDWEFGAIRTYNKLSTRAR